MSRSPSGQDHTDMRRQRSDSDCVTHCQNCSLDFFRKTDNDAVDAGRQADYAFAGTDKRSGCRNPRSSHAAFAIDVHNRSLMAS